MLDKNIWGVLLNGGNDKLDSYDYHEFEEISDIIHFLFRTF